MHTPRRAVAGATRVDTPALENPLSVHDHGLWRPAQWAGDQGRVLAPRAAAVTEPHRWNSAQWVGDQGKGNRAPIRVRAAVPARTDRPTGFCQCGIADGGQSWVLRDRPVALVRSPGPAVDDARTAA